MKGILTLYRDVDQVIKVAIINSPKDSNKELVVSLIEEILKMLDLRTELRNMSTELYDMSKKQIQEALELDLNNHVVTIPWTTMRLWIPNWGYISILYTNVYQTD